MSIASRGGSLDLSERGVLRREAISNGSDGTGKRPKGHGVLNPAEDTGRTELAIQGAQIGNQRRGPVGCRRGRVQTALPALLIMAMG